MININFVLPEIFISISIMSLLLIGVFKNKSSEIVYSLSVVSLIILLSLIINLNSISQVSIFNDSYSIDRLSTFMKILVAGSGIFVMISSKNYVKTSKIFKIEYPILLLSSILGMLVMIRITTDHYQKGVSIHLKKWANIWPI